MNKFALLLIVAFSVFTVSFDTDKTKTDFMMNTDNISINIKHPQADDKISGSALIGFGTSPDNWVSVDFYNDAKTLSSKDQEILRLFASILRSSNENVRTVHVRCIVFKYYFEDTYGYDDDYCEKIGEERARYLADYLINTLGLNIDVTWNIEVE